MSGAARDGEVSTAVAGDSIRLVRGLTITEAADHVNASTAMHRTAGCVDSVAALDSAIGGGEIHLAFTTGETVVAYAWPSGDERSGS